MKIIIIILISFFIYHCGVKSPPLQPLQGDMQLDQEDLDKEQSEEQKKKQ